MTSYRALLLVIAALFAPVLALAQSDGACTPEFPFKGDWWGADAAYSIRLADGRSVWIFGDTLYGHKRVVEGNEPRMVRNSIGISTCRDGKWEIEYVMRHDDAGRYIDFFRARSADTWYWALDGFRHQDQLWVTLLCMRATKANTLGFETCGTDLAKLTDLGPDPEKWKVEYFPLVPDGTRAYPSATALVEGDYAYIFALYEVGNRPMLLTRIPLAGLDDPQKNLQYLAKDGAWKPGFEPAKAKHVMKSGASEMSVRYHPGRKQWLAVMLEPKLSSGKIVLRTAPRMTGPWTNDKVIYRLPDVQKSTPGYDPDTVCYAGKEHPQFRRGDTIVFTYACNTLSVPKLTTNLGIYFPKAVRLPLPGR